jgi:hypothetical protein
MKNLTLTVLLVCSGLAGPAVAQQYVPPPPSRPSTGHTIIQAPGDGTKIAAPQAKEIKFANGARVVLYRDKFVFIAPDGRNFTKRRPLPELARSPWGCKWLRNYLDTTSPYTRNWIDNCYVYLERCEGLR